MTTISKISATYQLPVSVRAFFEGKKRAIEYMMGWYMAESMHAERESKRKLSFVVYLDNLTEWRHTNDWIINYVNSGNNEGSWRK